MNDRPRRRAILFVGDALPVDALRNRVASPVLVEGTLKRALRRIRDDDVGSVVTDYPLPDGDGIELIAAVRDGFPDLPVVLWTGDGDESIASEAIAAGVTDYVVRNGAPADRVVDRILTSVEESPDSRRDEVTERTLERGRRHYRTLVEQFPNGIVTLFDEDHRYQLVGGRGFDQLSVSADDLEGNRLQDVFPPANVEVLEPHYRRAFEGQASSVEVTLEDHVFRIHVVPVCDDDGTVFAGMTTSQDITDQKELERDLRERELRLKQAQDIADVGSWDLDVTNDDLRWSDNCYRIFGIQPGEPVTYERFLDRVHPGDRAAVDEAWNAALSGEPYDIEHRIQVDGETRWVREKAELEFDDDGAPQSGVGAVQDVTEQKERERALELFRDLVDHASDAIYAIDPDTADFVDANEASCRMLGYSRSEVLSMSVPDVNTEFTMAWWEELVDAASEEEEQIFESTHRRKDGSTFPVEIKVRRVELDSDYHVHAVRDITERKERERALRASEERFRSLIETAPDPIFVADTETGEIVETNTAACAIRKQSREEILGLPQTALHPEGEADRYRALFERHIEQGGTISQFPDGSPVYMTTADGERVPVSISAQPVALQDRTYIHGIFHDVSDQKRYEQSLEGLNRATRSFLKAESRHEVAATTVDVATDVLSQSGAAVYFYDDENGTLAPASHESSIEGLIQEPPTFPPGDSIAWRVYAEQEATVLDDVRTDHDVFNPGTPVRSELLVPLGSHGILLVGDTDVGVFDSMQVELAEVLAATAEAALDRIDRARELRERERDAQLHAKQLERVNRINDRIRSIIRAIVLAETHQEIEQAVCDHLVDIDRFAFAWIGEPNFVTTEVTPVAWAGSTTGYLDTISLDLDSNEGEPAVTATERRETTVVQPIADSLQQEAWRKSALLESYRSVVSIPLLHDDVLYGVLTIYGSRPAEFDDLSTAVLTEMGELIGYALNATEQRNASHGTEIVELTFELSDPVDTLTALASRLAGELEIKNISSRPDGSHLVHLLAHDVDADRFADVASESERIDDVRAINDTNPRLFEFVLSGTSIATGIEGMSATPHSIKLSERGNHISVSIPRDRDVRAFIERCRIKYPDATLIRRRDSEWDDSPLRLSSLLDRLTARQQEVLRAAYYGGFFERPRRSTGSEIADSLGISQPAFSKQLRNCERRLLKPFYEPE